MAVPIIPPGAISDAVPQNNAGFEYLGNQYVFVFRTTNDPPDPGDAGSWHAMQSTDGGLNWAELDLAGAPQRPFAPPLNLSFDSVWTIGRDGNQAILLWVNADELGIPGNTKWGNFTISKCVFDLDSGLWGSIVTQSASFMGLLDYQTNGFPVGHSNRTSLQMIVRGTADYLLYISGTESGSEPSQKGRCSYVTYNGSTFGAEVQLPLQNVANFYMPAGAVFDPVSGNTHFLYVGSLFNTGNMNVYHVALDGLGNFGATVQVIDSLVVPGALNAGANLGPNALSQPILYSVAGVPHLAFLCSTFDASFNVIVQVFTAPEELAPTFVSSDVTSDQSVAPISFPTISKQPQMFTLVANGAPLLASWIVAAPPSTPSFVYFSQTSLAAVPTWPTPPAIAITFSTDAVLHIATQTFAFRVVGGFLLFASAESSSFSVPTFDNQITFIPSIELAFSNAPGVVGHPYSEPLIATGGTGVYVDYQITAGSLPPGLSLVGHLIVGTPTTPGRYDFTAQVTDDADATATGDFFIVITLASVIIQLIGWKLYRKEPCDTSMVEVPPIEPPCWKPV